MSCPSELYGETSSVDQNTTVSPKKNLYHPSFPTFLPSRGRPTCQMPSTGEFDEDDSLSCFCLPLEALLLFLAKPLAEAVGLSDKFKNVCLVREPVKQSSRHCLVPKNGIPVTKPQIGCSVNTFAHLFSPTCREVRRSMSFQCIDPKVPFQPLSLAQCGPLQYTAKNVFCSRRWRRWSGQPTTLCLGPPMYHISTPTSFLMDKIACVFTYFGSWAY